MILLSVYEDMFVLYGGVDQLPNGACPGQYRKDHTQDLLEALPKAVRAVNGVIFLKLGLSGQ